jgi:hypothetical protein
MTKKFFHPKTRPMKNFTSFAFLLALLNQGSAIAQITSCAATECRMNQTSGTSSSVGVGVTSTFGVSSSASSSPGYNTSATASLVLNAFDSNVSKDLGYNSNIQSIGSKTSDAPINIKITSETIQTKNKDGATTQDFGDKTQKTASEQFIDNSSTVSNAEFSAEGFGASQDLRFKGKSDAGNSTEFKTEVTPIIKLDKDGNQIIGTEYATSNASANAQTGSRFQADINTSNFANSFMSTF